MAKTYNDALGSFTRGEEYWRWMKPQKYRHYKTVKELACALHVDPLTLKRLERAGTIPEPARVSRGLLRIRLYSPENEEEIKRILKEGKFRKRRGRKPSANKNG